MKSWQSISREILPSNEVHVWHLPTDGITAGQARQRFTPLLSEQELARLDRFLRAEDQTRFLLCRALLRTTITRYLGEDPRQLAFKTNAYGCPSLDTKGPVPLIFNLSRTRGRIALAVSQQREIGIDLEDTLRPEIRIEDAAHYFSPSEIAALQASQESGQRDLFFKFWTLKESYIKARQMGLSIPLDRFSLDLSRGEEIRISFSPPLEDDPQTWRFELRRIEVRYQFALAMRVHKGETVPIQWRESSLIHEEILW